MLTGLQVFIRLAVIICVTLVNTQTDRHTNRQLLPVILVAQPAELRKKR